MSKHTPAPWNYDLGPHRVTSQGGHHLVAEILGWHQSKHSQDSAKTQHANGYLIAAAPDLLAELENLSAVMACHDKTPEETLALEAAKRAIAKAKGGQS